MKVSHQLRRFVGGLLAVGALAMPRAVCSQSATSGALPPIVQSDWLQAELARPDLVILQLSSAEAFATTHIPGAVVLDYNSEILGAQIEGGLRTELPSPDVFEGMMRAKGITSTSRVILVFDQPNSFTRTGRAFFTFEWAGLAGRVAVLDGGLPKWVREGRPVAAGTGRIPAPGSVSIVAEPGRRATLDEVRRAIGRSGVRIVDARDTVFYQDLRDNGMPRGGHIPSAVNLPFSFVTNDDGTLRSRAELESLVRDAGIEEGDSLVSYCHIGTQASWMYFTLRVLGRDVRMFDGSFEEWSRTRSVPVEGARARPE